MPGYLRFGFFDLSLIGTTPTDRTDIFSALNAWWGSTSELIGGLGALHFGAAPVGTGFPYCVVSEVGSKSGGKSGGSKRYWEDKLLRFAIWADDLDTVVTLGSTVDDELGALAESKLVFANGTQMTCYRKSDQLLGPMTTPGLGGTLVYQQSYIYRAVVGRIRP